MYSHHWLKCFKLTLFIEPHQYLIDVSHALSLRPLPSSTALNKLHFERQIREFKIFSFLSKSHRSRAPRSAIEGGGAS